MKRTSNNLNEQGFTLVELAIVLMIIGLLIGGVLRGQELVHNARINGTIQQVNAYHGAMTTFRDEYSAYPGDLPTAVSRIPNCTATNYCANGDGNSRIGVDVYDVITDGADQTGTAVPKIETSLFWKHMALTHLISGIDPSADIAKPDWGRTHPAAKIGGGFTVFFSAKAGDWGIGPVLRLQISPNSTGPTGAMALSPIDAKQIDQKMDDGLGDSGSVSADFGGGCDGGPGGAYLLSEAKSCIMYFNLN